MTQGMEESLAMTHLQVPSSEEIKEQVERDVQPEQAVVSPAVANPRDKKTWTFSFDWTDARGKQWLGEFTNSIMTIGQSQAASVMRARFGGGMPLDSLADDMQIINRAIAHMSFSLSGENRPEWSKDLRAVEDPTLIIALWGRVSSHETRYFRLGEVEEGGTD